MIYLIGGPPRGGKTSVARQLASVVGCPWMQGDWLETAFSAYVAAGEYVPAAHRLDIDPNIPRGSRNDVVYAKFSAEDIIAYYRALAARAWPGLQALIEYALFDEEDLIIEGFQVDPDSVQQFLADSDVTTTENIRPVFLYREDKHDILASIKSGTDKNDWVLTKTRQPETYERIAAMIAQYGTVIRIAAERHGFASFSMDHDFAEQIERVIVYLQEP